MANLRRAFFMAGDGGAYQARTLRSIGALDNGAFSSAKRGEQVLVEAYTEFVQKYHYLLDVIFSCDVIGDEDRSLKNFFCMRDGGLSVVPVWHDGTPLQYLEFYLSEPDINYVAIGRHCWSACPEASKSLKRL